MIDTNRLMKKRFLNLMAGQLIVLVCNCSKRKISRF